MESGWKKEKMHQVLPDWDSRASTKSSQLNASVALLFRCEVEMHTVWREKLQQTALANTAGRLEV